MKMLLLPLLIALGVVVALTLWLLLSEPRILFQGTRPLEATPADWGWRYEEVALTAADGTRLHGWWIPAPPGTPGAVTVLFLHGNAGNISHRREKLGFFRELGANVLIVDYRGYGRSEGRPDETGLHADARAAYDHAVGERGVRPTSMILFGESLGAAVAVRLATEVEAGALVLESVFTSITEVARATYPVLPVAWLVRNRFDAIGRIGRVRAPVLILHSRDDEYFPMSHARRLATATRPPARLVELRGGHNDAFLVSERAYRRALEEMLARVSAAAGPAPE